MMSGTLVGWRLQTANEEGSQFKRQAYMDAQVLAHSRNAVSNTIEFAKEVFGHGCDGSLHIFAGHWANLEA